LSSAPANWEWEEGPSLLGSIWRYKWLLVAGTLIGAALGFGFSNLQPTLYESGARILLLNADTGQSQAKVDPARNLQNQVNVITSASVLNRASERQGDGLTLEEVRARVTVEASTDADVITIHALDPTPKGAAKLANSVALAYEDMIGEDARQQAADAIETAKVEEARLRRRLTQLEAAQADNPDSAALQAEVATVTSQLHNVFSQQLQLDQDANRRAGSSEILREPAAIPTQPTQPKRLRNMAGGALLLLVATVGLAWTLTARRMAAGTRAPAIAGSTTRPGLPGNGGRSAVAEGRSLAAERPSASLEHDTDAQDGLRAAPRAWAADAAATTQAAGNGSEPGAALRPFRRLAARLYGRPRVNAGAGTDPASGARPSGERPGKPARNGGPAWPAVESGEAASLKETLDASEGTAEAPMLTPELMVAFERLTTSLQEVMEVLRLDGWSAAEQSLPQLEAEKAVQYFGLDIAVILLDDGEGRLQVAGEVGLTPVERRKAIRYDPNLWPEMFDGGARLVDEKERERLAAAGVPGDKGGTLLMIPLVHAGLGFGLVLASVRPDGRNAAASDELDVESMTAYGRVIEPTLWSWVLLGRLKLGLGEER
jgi:capsular polysaccharide biosynthesis protein